MKLLYKQFLFVCPGKPRAPSVQDVKSESPAGLRVSWTPVPYMTAGNSYYQVAYRPASSNGGSNNNNKEFTVSIITRSSTIDDIDCSNNYVTITFLTKLSNATIL